jgi:lipopolysaccharide biosynthesis glycosyltransferase
LKGFGIQLKKSLGIVTIATNKYLGYWEELVLSFDNTNLNLDVNFHVFTDRVLEANEFHRKIPNKNILIHEISNYGWPNATLLRYEIINKFSDSLDEEYLMHLDADMLFTPDFSSIFNGINMGNYMNFVLHPGFYRNKGNYKNNLSLERIVQKLKDIKLLVTLGGIGAWETRKTSSAFVPRGLRKKYFCGATWFGDRTSFMNFTKKMEKQVSNDFEKGVIAIWHDESHLNSFTAKNDFKELSPTFCFDELSMKSSGIKPAIIAVRK